ncbi:MAG: DUF1259 domain-containing protein, partial [Fibrella sp.]|nr:DUF1259 domain-containing protein [Armatimonadota bacterium]
MNRKLLDRRGLLRAASVIGAAGVLAAGRETVASPDDHDKKRDRAISPVKTAPLTTGEIVAIEKALGKKGNVNESQSLYTVPLPRNDLRVSIKGEPVPIPFGFGGWVSFKRSVDGKSVMVMSDTV